MKRFAKDERGVSAIEYAILAALIVGAVTAGAITMKGNITTLFATSNTKITSANTAAAR
ncbi:Flp family type IVb pilin [Paraburkholderia sp. PREW-6R]|uniref:Flp family type IVb pilin n=1 Tax=Paraburkholderia sp. PREW-6R TaxID=3141544 RepID=UPI0031F48AE9